APLQSAVRASKPGAARRSGTCPSSSAKCADGEWRSAARRAPARHGTPTRLRILQAADVNWKGESPWLRPRPDHARPDEGQTESVMEATSGAMKRRPLPL